MLQLNVSSESVSQTLHSRPRLGALIRFGVPAYVFFYSLQTDMLQFILDEEYLRVNPQTSPSNGCEYSTLPPLTHQ